MQKLKELVDDAFKVAERELEAKYAQKPQGPFCLVCGSDEIVTHKGILTCKCGKVTEHPPHYVVRWRHDALPPCDGCAGTVSSWSFTYRCLSCGQLMEDDPCLGSRDTRIPRS
jgi:hypothetical protein